MEEETTRRMTDQRRAILEELQNARTHPTANELYERVRRKLPHISLGTVYRNLDLLARSGLARRLQGEGGEARYDGVVEEHFHVRCIDCGRVDDVAGPLPKALEASLGAAPDYEVVGFRLELLGRCSDCRRAQRRETARNRLGIRK